MPPCELFQLLWTAVNIGIIIYCYCLHNFGFVAPNISKGFKLIYFNGGA